MRKLWSSILAFGLATFSLGALADTNIAVIDLRHVLEHAPQVAAMQEKLKAEFKPQQKKIEELQTSLKANADKLKKDSTVIKEDDKKKLEQTILDQQQQLQSAQVTFQQNLLAAQQKDIQAILDKVHDIVATVAKEQKLDVVVAKEAAFYNSDKLDISQQVADKLAKAK